MSTPRSKYIPTVLATAAVYLAGAKMGLTLAFVAEQVTVVWPPTGIALAAVFLLGYRVWPAIAVGAFIANITNNTPVLTSLGITAGNTLEALAGAYLLNRFVKFEPSLVRFRDVFGLVFFGAIVSPIISASIGVISLCVTGIQVWDRFASLWSVWFIGDAMGVVIVAPLVFTFFSQSFGRLRRRGLSEFIALVVILTVFDAYIFSSEISFGSRYHTPVYAIFPFLIWAAFRFGPCGTAVTGFITATIAVLGTVKGFGPFTVGGTNDNLISLELFLFVATMTGLMIAVSETQRAFAERSSYESNERYGSLVMASSQVVWTTNSAGEVVDDLPTWRAFTGQTKEEMMGRGWGRKLHPDDVDHVSRVWEYSLATGTPHEVEFRVLAADGTYRHVSARAVPVLELDGTIREWVGTLTDITEKQKAQREMLEANQRKDEFLAMLAHELRNPLAPIRNALQVLRRIEPPDRQLQWALDVIDRQLHNLTRLVDDLLDVSRITQGKVTLQKETVELASIVTRAVETSHPLIDSRRHQFTVSLPPEPVFVDADPIRMAQALANLLNNAAKYTEEGGRIWLTVTRTADEVTLRVRDTGVGIPLEVLPHVFDLFSQADRSLDRSQGGLGIGLTLVRNLVQMHGGRVEASSDGSGKGSEFVVHLPALPEGVLAVETKSPVASQIGPATSLRILVVDDNLDSAESLALLLELSTHVVRIAHDGETALESAVDFVPEVVLLDIGLPKIDGYEVARRLRELPQMKKVVLVALTGYGQEGDRERSKQAGFDHHLVKPVDPSQLETLLISWCSR